MDGGLLAHLLEACGGDEAGVAAIPLRARRRGTAVPAIRLGGGHGARRWPRLTLLGAEHGGKEGRVRLGQP